MINSGAQDIKSLTVIHVHKTNTEIMIIIHTRCKYFDPCYARATVVRARFLAAAFSDGSYLAHVNGPYLRHVTFCIVRGPPLFIVSPICERGSRAAVHLRVGAGRQPNFFRHLSDIIFVYVHILGRHIPTFIVIQ